MASAPAPPFMPPAAVQPALLDRLLDDEPGQQQPAREPGFITVRRLRAAVLRDLGWLLNAVAWQADAVLDRVCDSTLCYGLPDLAGTSASTIDPDELAERVRHAIERFEPRLLPQTLAVRVRREDDAGPNTLTMTIEAELWAVPAPLHLVVNTLIDLESGRVAVRDGSR